MVRSEDESRRSGSEEPPYGGSSEREIGRGSGTSRRFTPAEKQAILEEFTPGQETLTAYCTRRGITSTSFCLWRRQFAERGLEGLLPKRNPRNHRKTRRSYSPEDRRAAVEAFFQSGRTRKEFAVVWGVTTRTLGVWIRQYREHGPKGLEPAQRKSAPKRLVQNRISEHVEQEIVRTRRRFEHFGLKRVVDFLRRFQGVSVSSGTVRRVLSDHGIQSQGAPVKKLRRKPSLPRRFERSRPGELWQSDITSFVLAGSGQRVYLTVFLDDHSRFIVSHALKLQQRADLVIEALLEAIGRYGKPREILTDQGRQYFAWRGKSAFQKLLLKEDIQHVVARARHPQTVGKTERFWATVNREFWERARPRDLSEARDRLCCFIDHYNHFRPHQGISGLVPADRFFESREALRRTIEARLEGNELDRAVQRAPRKPLYLFGQVGDQQVALHGEKGRVVIQTPDGVRQEMELEELGMPPRRNRRQLEESGNGRTGEEADPTQEGQEAGGLPAAEEIRAAGEGPVGAGERGGEGKSAHAVCGDAGVLAGPDHQAGRDGEAPPPGAAGVAAVADGVVRYVGGPVETATELFGGEHGDRPGRGPEGPEKADPGAGTEARADRGPGPAAARSSRQPAGADEAEPEAEGPAREKKQATTRLERLRRLFGGDSGSDSR